MRNGGAQDWRSVLREIGKRKRRMDEQNMETCVRYLEDAGAEELRRDGMRLTFRLPDVKETKGSILDAERVRFSDGREKQNSDPGTGDGQFSLRVCGDRVILSRLLVFEPGQVLREAQHVRIEPGEQSGQQLCYKEQENRLELRSVFRLSDLRRGKLAADILRMNRYIFCLEQIEEGHGFPIQDRKGTGK